MEHLKGTSSMWAFSLLECVSSTFSLAPISSFLLTRTLGGSTEGSRSYLSSGYTHRGQMQFLTAGCGLIRPKRGHLWIEPADGRLVYLFLALSLLPFLSSPCHSAF